MNISRDVSGFELAGAGDLNILRQQMTGKTLRHLFAVVDGFVAATCAVRQFFISCASRDMLTPPPDAVAIFSGAWGMHGRAKAAPC